MPQSEFFVSPEILTGLILVGFYGGIFALILFARAFLIYWYKKVIGLKKSVLLVRVPKEAGEKKGDLEKEKALQELQEDIAVGEKLFNAIGGLRAQRGVLTWFI